MRRSHRILLLVFIIAVVAVSSARMIGKPPDYGDFGVYLNAARMMADGENIYLRPAGENRLSYIYPPLLALLLIPLTAVPVNIVIVLWCLLNVVLVAWIVRLFHAVLEGSRFDLLSTSTEWMIAGASILLTARFLQHNLDRGQVNLVPLFLATLAVGMMSGKSPKHFAGGVLIGLSIAIKVLTLPLAVWYLLKGVRTTAGIVVGTVAGLLLPALFLGFERNWFLLRFWLDHYALDSAQQESNLGQGYNFSVLAQLQRFLTPVDAFQWNGHSYSLMIVQLPAEWIGIADWGIRAVLLGLLIFYVIRYGRYGRYGKSPAVLNGGVALAFALVPLVFPTTQINYFVFLLPAYVYAVHLWYCVNLKDRWFRGLVVASFIAGSIMTGELWGKLMADIFLAAGFLLWGSLLLIAALFRAADVLKTTKLAS